MRSGTNSPGHTAVGDVELDAGTRVVLQKRRLVELTAVEFDLLEILLRTAGSVVPRSDLVEKVLGRGLDPCDRSIDVHTNQFISIWT